MEKAVDGAYKPGNRIQRSGVCVSVNNQAKGGVAAAEAKSGTPGFDDARRDRGGFD